MAEVANQSLALVPKIDTADDDDTNNFNNQSPPATVIIDSLPYIDYLHPDYEAYALSLVEHEMQKDDPTRTRLHEKCSQFQLPNDNNNSTNGNFLRNAPISLQEYKQLESRNGEPRTTDTSTILFHTTISEPQGALSNDENAWNESTKALKTEIEKQRHVNINLQLQQIFESGQWRMYNASLEQFSIKYQSIVANNKRKIDEINAIRASKQQGISDRLNQDNMKWADLVRKNCKLVLATDALEREVKRRRKDLGISDEDAAKDDDNLENA